MNFEQPISTRYPQASAESALPGSLAGQPEVEPLGPPRIWVVSLTDYYYDGTVHAAWIEAAQDEAQLQSEVDRLLTASPLAARTGEPAKEWAIHDYENFGPLRIDEQEDLTWISRVAKGIAEHGTVFAAYANVMQAEELLDSFDYAYLGHYDSLQAYVEQLVNDLGYDRILDENLPASIRPYVKIDIAATAHDLELGGDLHAVPAAEGGVWIFRG